MYTSKKLLVGLFTFMTFACCPTMTRADGDTYFYFDSAPQSWVGRGYTNYYVSLDVGWSITATHTEQQVVRISIDRIAGPPPFDNYYWDLNLAAPFGQPMVPGLYLNATRFPFQGLQNNGMALTGNHRGNNTLTGHFEVLEAVYGPGETLERFAVNFTQYDEGNLNWWIVGELRFNSIAVPEPSSIALAGTALAGAFICWSWKKRRRSMQWGCE